MTTIINSIPAGIVTRFLPEMETADVPVIWRESTMIFIPVFVRKETTDGVDKYRFFNVPVAYTGQDITDYEKCIRQSWASIRKFFYGSAEAQNEMKDDHLWEGHRQAVRSAFPKHEGEGNPAQVRFEAIKAAFWETIDAVLASVEKTREDLPAQPFNAEQMAAWAADPENAVPADVIKAATEKLSVISLDLLHNDRNWSELFA